MFFPFQKFRCQVSDGLGKAEAGGEMVGSEAGFFEGVDRMAPAIDLLVGIADDDFGGILREENAEHGGGCVLSFIEEDIIVIKYRVGQLKLFKIEIVDDPDLTAVH